MKTEMETLERFCCWFYLVVLNLVGGKDAN